MSPTMPCVSSNGVVSFYDEVGSDNPVVAVPGLGATHVRGAEGDGGPLDTLGEGAEPPRTRAIGANVGLGPVPLDITTEVQSRLDGAGSHPRSPPRTTIYWVRAPDGWRRPGPGGNLLPKADQRYVVQ
jgi:hypothetical protein